MAAWSVVDGLKAKVEIPTGDVNEVEAVVVVVKLAWVEEEVEVFGLGILG